MAKKATERGYGWTQQGTKVWVEYVFPNGEYLVQSVLHGMGSYGDGDYSDEVLGDLRVVDAGSVWDAAPVEVLDAKVVKLQAKVAELEGIVGGLRETAARERAEQEERRKKYVAFPQLAQLDKFIAGQITHYVRVEKWKTPQIIAFKDSESDYNTGERGLDKMKLLTLYGRSKGDLQWHLNHYSDGSGSGFDVIPCASLEEAQEVFRAEWAKRFEGSESASLLKKAEQADVAIPEDFRQRVRAAVLRDAKAALDKANKERDEAQAKLDAVMLLVQPTADEMIKAIPHEEQLW